jgi:amidase
VPDSDLMFRPASELAGMVRSGEVSSRELVEISLARIEELNPQLNAFVQVDAERALATAAEIGPGDERPFAGVPIAIKNNRPVAGLRATIGCSLLAEHVADRDGNITRRLKDAGFVIVGTTTLPEYGILPVSEARIFGPTRNPWDLQRTPGGSSGGSAAAVASGMVPVAHGNDGGGSIRIPAACCGLVGLKPARGRISAAPERGEAPLDVDGVLTRTVADTAAILDVLAGYELGDATWAPPPSEPFAQSARDDGGPPTRLRIAATTFPPTADAVVDPICAQAVADAAGLLRSLGHEVEEVDPPWRIEGLSELFGAVFSIHIALQIAYSGMVAGRGVGGISEKDMEPMSWAIYQMTQGINSVQGLGLEIQLQALTRQLVAFLAPYDALLTPALAERPLPIGTLDTAAADPMSTFTRSGLFTPFTPIFNASGQPGISLPLFQGEDGLPLGVQLVGRPVGEAALLALGAQLEEARPWAERRAPLVS